MPSTLPGTRLLRMKEERKRMKAFGGRGMCARDFSSCPRLGGMNSRQRRRALSLYAQSGHRFPRSPLLIVARVYRLIVLLSPPNSGTSSGGLHAGHPATIPLLLQTDSVSPQRDSLIQSAHTVVPPPPPPKHRALIGGLKA